MSRRLNRDSLPLHKPEACSRTLLWTDLVRGRYFHSIGLDGLVDSPAIGWNMSWSLTYVATPIAVAVSEAFFTSSGLPIRLVEVCSHLSSVQLCYVMFG